MSSLRVVDDSVVALLSTGETGERLDGALPSTMSMLFTDNLLRATRFTGDDILRRCEFAKLLKNRFLQEGDHNNSKYNIVNRKPPP